EGAFDAMRATLPQHLAHRKHRVAVRLVVGRDGVDEGLDTLWRGKPRKARELARRQSEGFAASGGAGGSGHHDRQSSQVRGDRTEASMMIFPSRARATVRISRTKTARARRTTH